MPSDSIRFAAGGAIRLVDFPASFVFDDWEQKGGVAVRTYDGVVATPVRREGRTSVAGAIYDSGGTLIKESERQAERGRASANAEVLPTAPPTARLRGSYIFAGLAIRPFGHVLVEFLSRLWWVDNLEDLSGQRILMQPYRGTAHPSLNLPMPLQRLLDRVRTNANTRYLETPWFAGFLDLLGLAPDQVSFIPAQGARIERLTIASPVITVNGAAHAAFPRIYDRIAERACGNIVPDGRRVYLSRAKLRSNKRRAVNETELQAYLVEQGFQIVYPEQLPLVEQIRLIRNADVVSGCGGSAMHMLSFARPGTRALVLDSRAINNQFAIEQVRGIRATHLWMGSRKPFRSSSEWRIDLDMVRRHLPSVIAPSP